MDEVLAKASPFIAASQDPSEMREMRRAGSGKGASRDDGTSLVQIPRSTPQPSAASLRLLPEDASQVKAGKKPEEGKDDKESGEGTLNLAPIF